MGQYGLYFTLLWSILCYGLYYDFLKKILESFLRSGKISMSEKAPISIDAFVSQKSGDRMFCVPVSPLCIVLASTGHFSLLMVPRVAS
eukprot:181639-Chlamydomonas_euryale.AAC.2